jgi:hypothetical protein
MGTTGTPPTVNTSRLDTIMADIGNIVDKVEGYADKMIDDMADQQEELNNKKEAIDAAFVLTDEDANPLEEALFNNIIKTLTGDDVLDTEITNDLRDIILVQMGLTGDIDGDGTIEDAETLNRDQIEQFKEILSATLVTYKDSDSLKAYVESFSVDNNNDTDATFV